MKELTLDLYLKRFIYQDYKNKGILAGEMRPAKIQDSRCALRIMSRYHS